MRGVTLPVPAPPACPPVPVEPAEDEPPVPVLPAPPVVAFELPQPAFEETMPTVPRPMTPAARSHSVLKIFIAMSSLMLWWRGVELDMGGYEPSSSDGATRSEKWRYTK